MLPSLLRLLSFCQGLQNLAGKHIQGHGPLQMSQHLARAGLHHVYCIEALAAPVHQAPAVPGSWQL
jgi:hypothetical protein